MLYSNNDEPAAVSSEKQTVKLKLQDFVDNYTANASLFNAKHSFDWTLKSGDKADTITIAVNDGCSMLISAKKTEGHELLGVTFVVGSLGQKDMMEALSVLYTLIKPFEPTRDQASILDFVGTLSNQTAGEELKTGGVVYTVNEMAGNTIIFIMYAPE